MTEAAYLTAEARARVDIDRQLGACGWVVQDRGAMNLYAGPGVAVREFIMAAGHGRAETLDDAAGLPAPGVLAAEIVEELQAALAQFAELAASLPVEEA